MKPARALILFAAMLAAAWLLLPPQGAEMVSILLVFVGVMLKLWRIGGDAVSVESNDPPRGDCDSEILRESV